MYSRVCVCVCSHRCYVWRILVKTGSGTRLTCDGPKTFVSRRGDLRVTTYFREPPLSGRTPQVAEVRWRQDGEERTPSCLRGPYSSVICISYDSIMERLPALNGICFRRKCDEIISRNYILEIFYVQFILLPLLTTIINRKNETYKYVLQNYFS